MIYFNNKNFFKGSKLTSGYTLVELVFYVSLFAILSLTVIESMLVMTKSFKETTIQAELGESSGVAERISREIRKASSVSTISTSDLVLNTTDDAGSSKTVEFRLSGTNVQFLENGTLTGNLNASSITVTALSFTQINTANSVGIKFSLTTRSNNDSLNRTVDFYDTVVLRGGY